MIRYHHINGELFSASEAKINVTDLGLLRGYAIFDFFLVCRGIPLFVDDYLARFERSASLMRLKPPFSKARIKEYLLELLSANGREEAAVRLVLTGGFSEDGYTPATPNLLMLQYPAPVISGPDQLKGVKLIAHQYQRELPEVKTTNYLTGIHLLEEMKKAGATEVLYHDGTFIRESVRSNFFLVTRNDVLVTPKDKILYGITRKNVIQLALAHNIRVEERDILLEELHEAKEAFLTGSTKRILPVTAIDNLTIGGSNIGETTRQLSHLLEEFTQAYLTEIRV